MKCCRIAIALVLVAASALVSACCGGISFRTCCPPCPKSPRQGTGGAFDPTKAVPERDPSKFVPHKRDEIPLPPAPFKRIDLQHKDSSPGHKRINSATVTGKAAPDCSGSPRFPPPPGVNGPPHVLVSSSAPLDFQPSPITNPVFWPGQSIPSFPQDVKGVTFEIQFEGETQMHVTCLSAPGGKQMDSIIIKYDGMQNNQHHLGGSIRYIDGFDPVTQAPIFKTEAIDILLQ